MCDSDPAVMHRGTTLLVPEGFMFRGFAPDRADRSRPLTAGDLMAALAQVDPDSPVEIEDLCAIAEDE